MNIIILLETESMRKKQIISLELTIESEGRTFQQADICKSLFFPDGDG